jgi:hypothetical protein
MRKHKGQSTLEFSILIFCIVAALVSMSVYIKRGIQGRLRSNAEEISQSKYAPGQTEGYFKSSLTQQKDVVVYKEPGEDEISGKVYTGNIFKRDETINNETITVQGTETVD